MITCRDTELVQFVAVLDALETGYHSGHFAGRGFGMTIERPARARITKLFARELGGSDRVSFNLFKTGGDNFVLKPCEMSTRRVIDFVLHFEPDNQSLSIGSFEKEA